MLYLNDFYIPYCLSTINKSNKEADFCYMLICAGVCLNTGQVYECVNESLCEPGRQVKLRQSQKCSHGVKSSDRE